MLFFVPILITYPYNEEDYPDTRGHADVPACTKEGDVIYQTDPADAPSTTPLVTVIYDPNGVGDGNYNDLLYLETSEPLDGKGSTLCLP